MRTFYRGQQLVDAGLGELLKSLRLFEGMTQADVAEATGYSRTSVTNIEAGRQGVTFDQLVLMMRMIGYDMHIELVHIGR
jgi:transcriptional regulator with XRE-family HTH domain